MNDSMKELEKKIKNGWPAFNLSEASQQAILLNIKMHQRSRSNKFGWARKFKISYGLSIVAVILVAFVLVSPILHKKHNDSVQPNLTVQKDPTIKGAHPPKVKEETKTEFYFPQKFTDKDSVFIDENIGWKIDNRETGGMSRESVSISKTIDGGKTWMSVTNINGQENNNLLTGYKRGITFINKMQGWISIFVDPDPKSPYLLQTKDGGKNWTKQYLPIPEQFNQEPRQITRPVFFSNSDGIIPIISFDTDSKLLYMEVTHDSGKTWTPVTEQSSQNLTWDFSDSHNGMVTYNNKTWVTPDLGETWDSQK